MERLSIRELVDNSIQYYQCNREERNYAAILFALLCNQENLKKFLQFLEINEKINDNIGIYFEYAFLRDLWDQIEDEHIKKQIIRTHLNVSGIDEILDQEIVEINRIFGVMGNPSPDHVQYPGKWSIRKYHEHPQFSENEEFLKVCKFKWAFNIKPDVVIHLSSNKAICIEAKYKSGQGTYPGSDTDKKVFDNRNLERVKQTEVQRYLMEELLGIKTHFVFLSTRESFNDSFHSITWEDTFKNLDLSDVPFCTRKMIEKISS